MDFMMTRSQLENLLTAYEESPAETLFELDTQIFTLLMRYYSYGQKEQRPMPDKLLCFMEIDSWQGMSQRCGVWQYYESLAFQRDTQNTVLSVLKEYGEEKMAKVYIWGIHEYDDPKYYDENGVPTGMYPNEWIESSQDIDDWIIDMENEKHIYEFKRRLILDSREVFIKLGNN